MEAVRIFTESSRAQSTLLQKISSPWFSRKYWMIRICDCFKLMHENIWAASIEHKLVSRLASNNFKVQE